MASRPGRSEARLAGERGRLAGNCLLAILVLAVLGSGAVLSDWPGADSASLPACQQTIARALDEDTTGTPGRLARTSLSAWGDLQVEVVLGDQGNGPGSRAAALDDLLRIARAVYQGPPPRPVTVTVLGLAGRGAPGASPVPVLYASLPADRLGGLDWTRVRPDDLPALSGVRWLPTGLCEAWQECAVRSG